jgi:heptosyltransferase-1
MTVPAARQKILVVKPSSLGDVVHSLPFLSALKSRYPEAEVHWVIARGLEDLLEGHPMIDKLIVINKDEWKSLSRPGRTIREITRLFRSLRREYYDIVVDLQGLLRSGVIAMAAGAPVRIGFEEAREGSRFFYNRKVRGGKELHAVDRYLKIADALGCSTQKVVFPFVPAKTEAGEAAKVRESPAPYAVIVPGARWDTKIWPAVNFGRVAAALPWRSIVVGSSADIPKADVVVRESGGKAVSLAGKTGLRELVEIMRNAVLVISNDSGPMHIAAAFGVPVVAIFGPTSPERTGPYGKGHIIIRSEETCSPCFKRRCEDLKCMKGITVATVLEKIDNSMQLHKGKGKRAEKVRKFGKNTL